MPCKPLPVKRWVPGRSICWAGRGNGEPFWVRAGKLCWRLCPPSGGPVQTLCGSAWEEAVRASSAVENWHSVLRPYLAVHRRLSTGMLALVACWHNHRIAERGQHQGLSPLMRRGLTPLSSDWRLTLGYPSQEATCRPVTSTNGQAVLALAA